MKLATVIITATAFVSLAAASPSGPDREEQYKAKYGRYTPAYEAKLTARKAVTPTECCRPMPPEPMSATDARTIAKYGRAFPARNPRTQITAANNGQPSCCDCGR